MTDSELDTVYTALAEALGRVGEGKTPLMLSTLCLSLLAKQADANAALELIAQAEKLAKC
jgi:hypothetical protein